VSHLTRYGSFRPEEDGQPATPPDDRAPLATCNPGHLGRLEGLVIEDWS